MDHVGLKKTFNHSSRLMERCFPGVSWWVAVLVAVLVASGLLMIRRRSLDDVPVFF